MRVPEDDLAALLDNQGRLRAMTTPEQIEELNPYYVAMTRATHHFRPSAEVMAALPEIPTAMRQADGLQLASSELKATSPPADRAVPPAGDAIRAL